MIRSLLFAVVAITATSLNAQLVNPDISEILEENRISMGLTAGDIQEYTVSNTYFTEHLGITHVYLQQRHKDIPLYNGILNLNLSGSKVVSFGNRWVRDLSPKAPSNVPTITARQAIQRAAMHLGQQFEAGDELKREQSKLGQDTRITFGSGGLSREDIPVELYWLAGEDKQVRLCWMVEIHETTAENVWLIFIGAHTGEYRKKDNLVTHCSYEKPFHSGDPANMHSDRPTDWNNSALFAPDSSYNVLAMPVESPNHGMRTIHLRPWTAAGEGNPAITLGWHDDGPDSYTITRGNNVHAYEDFDNNNQPGFSPDSFNLRFDYPFDPFLNPEDNIEASVTNLFYWNNIIHDVMYQYGFDEASGNFQNDNLGRGGEDGDYVRAEAQDGGGTSNANFFTPADGSRPRMQMYLWADVPFGSILTLNSPASVMGPMYSVESGFSSNNQLEDVGPVTGDLILVEDSGDTTHLACSTLSNAGSLTGKIAVIDRGNCNFTVKVKTAQNLGAIAAIVINNEGGAPFSMGGTDNTIVIPSIMVSLDDGNTLKAVMDTTTVNSTLEHTTEVTPIGDFDNGVITHEYGHGISNRLTGGPAAVSCLNNDEQMGEGWSDYFGLMLTTDWTTALPTDLRGIGTYVIGESPGGDGIRTFPYTTDMEVNPFTYASIGDAPVNQGNVSPHFVGSVWCTMLWDMTWKIIDMVGVDADMYHGTGGNNIALQLVIDALKLQPCNPGFVDGRDAILLADQIRNGGQYSCAIWEAFADRGLGVNAVQGSTNDHEDGVESFARPEGVFIETKPDITEAVEGQEVTFNIMVIGGCEGKSDLLVSEVLSDDLIYIPGSGGVLNGNNVEFSLDTLGVLDTMQYAYQAYIRPCSATGATLVLEDDADGSDQFESIQLAGSGTREWVKNNGLSQSPPNSWYARDYDNFADFALTLLNPLPVDGPVEVAFVHRYETEADYDGGIVEYSLNEGATWEDAGPYFIENSYPSSITTVNTDSPIAGQDAFTGDSDLQFGTNGFVQSTIRLNTNGNPTLMLRFRFVCDGGVGGSGINGWYIDDIRVRSLSGIVNQTRVSAGGVLVDSLKYGLATSRFEGHILFVDAFASGKKSGLSWEEAMNYLPNAIELAGCRVVDSIFIAEGSYLPGLDDDRQASFSLFDSTALFGGFPAGGSEFAIRDPLTYLTNLSGDIGAGGDPIDNAYHVVTIDSARQQTLLDGLFISGGHADGAGDNARGAAIFCEGELTMRNTTVMNNTGTDPGQIILVRYDNAQLSIQDCLIHTQGDGQVKLLSEDGGQLTIGGSTRIVKE